MDVMTETQSPPTIELAEFLDSSSAHIVLLVDLDAPHGASNNSFSPYLHWLLEVPKGTTQVSAQHNLSAVAEYVSPNPPVGYGPHRYVALLLADAHPNITMPGVEGVNFTDLFSRARFDVKDFIHQGSYKTVAANWFKSENQTGFPASSMGSGNRLDYIIAVPFLMFVAIWALVV